MSQEIQKLQQENKKLQLQLAEKEKDIEEIATFVFKTLGALGVKNFDDIDKVGKVALKEMPTIIFEASFSNAKLNQRFAHFDRAQPLLFKYKHLIPKS